MPLDMVSISPSVHKAMGRWLLHPHRKVVAWANAHDTLGRTMNHAVFHKLEERLLGCLEQGFADAIANIPSLARHESPPRSRFTAARLLASLRLAQERLDEMARDIGEDAANLDVAVAALNVHRGVGHLVAAGGAFDLWRLRGAELIWLRRHHRAPRFEPSMELLELRDGDVFGLGFVADMVPVAEVTATEGRFDELIRVLLSPPHGYLSGCLCRWRAGAGG